MEREEIESKYSIRKLQNGEDTHLFDCGDEDLNDFILNEAKLYRKELLAVSYVLEQVESHLVHAYFSMANDRISLADFESKTEFNRFRKVRFVNEKRMKSYPAVKLCRLAVDRTLKGHSIGTYLLNFIKSFFVVNNKTGCRFLTVDAYAPAIPFYEKNGFVLLNDDDIDAPTRLLYFDLKDIAVGLDQN